jgi:hypothetical protein
MDNGTLNRPGNRYADCIEKSKRIRWDIDADVIRGRSFDFGRKFLPDGLSRVERLQFLSADDQRLLSQVQGRTYANMFGMVERFIGAKMLDLSQSHWLGDQVALEALVRFTDEELKHQALFRRLEAMMAPAMPPGYRFLPDPNHIAEAVLGAHSWAVLALTSHIELFTQAHYLQSVQEDTALCPIFRDVLKFHWIEESQHAVIDELEWRRVHAGTRVADLDRAVDDLIQLVHAVDSVLQVQAHADSGYFKLIASWTLTDAEAALVSAGVLRAYRWQYLVSGFLNARFNALLAEMLAPDQLARIEAATRSLIAATSE